MKKNKNIYREMVSDRSWMTISNLLTVFRIFLTPVIVFGIFYQNWKSVFILFIIVALTDLLDGYFARLFNESTNLGKILDPIADKVLLVSSFASLAFLQSPSFLIPYWFVFLIFFRELTILLGSYFILLSGVELKIAPTIWGKLTTFFQLLFIFWLFVCYFLSWAPAKTYYFILGFLALFSLLSLGQYIKIGIKTFLRK